MGNVKSGRLIDPETEENISDVESTLSGLGIKLRDSGGEFRNFKDVLDEVASKWKDYGTVQQRAIAVAFSGTRQQEKFLTLMSHYDKAMEYAEVATNSAGTALKKYNDDYLNSTEASMEGFTAQYEQMSNSIWDSNLIKGTFDTGKGILGAITWLNKTLGATPVLISTVSGLLSGIFNKGELIIQEFNRTLRPFATDGNIGRDQYKYGILHQGVA